VDPAVAASQASADLTALAGVYGDLYEALITTRGHGISSGSGFKGRPPLEVHVLDVIFKVECHSRWTLEWAAVTVGQKFIPFRPWWNGEPNPMVPEAFLETAQRMSEAAVKEPNGTIWVADESARILHSVHGVIGRTDPASAAGDCPAGCGTTLVRMGARIACAVCDFTTFDVRNRI